MARFWVFGGSEKELIKIDLHDWFSEAEILHVVGFEGSFKTINDNQLSKVYEWDHADSSAYFNLLTPGKDFKEWWTS